MIRRALVLPLKKKMIYFMAPEGTEEVFVVQRMEAVSAQKSWKGMED